MLLRYPGGKGKASKVITSRILEFFEDHPSYNYCEPFFGAGAIGFALLEKMNIARVWFNDLDPAMYAVWVAVFLYAEALQALLGSFTPSVEKFFEFKTKLLEIDTADLLTNQTLIEIAFMKIATHQMSYSGLGTKAGGPIGGVSQTSKYDVGCRYSLKNLFKSIDKLNHMMHNRELDLTRSVDYCTCLDFEEVITKAWDKTFFYIDPPYYEKGSQLYQFSFTEEDHRRLASTLSKSASPWLLSYDDHPEVRKLYEGWSEVNLVDFTYTINAKQGGNKKQELLISNF